MHKHFQGDREMAEAMLAVVDAMSEEQRAFVAERWKPDDSRLLIETLEKLISLVEEETVFEDLPLVLEALTGEDEETGEEEDEEHDEEG